MIGGQANEAITIGTGASFSLVSTLQIEVLDKGIGVEGATIIVDGQTVQTDISGQVTAQTTARTVDAPASKMPCTSMIASDEMRNSTPSFTVIFVDGAMVKSPSRR